MGQVLEIDGQELSFSQGQTVLEVAKENGIDIPTLCYDPYLKSIGACRVCLVEEKNTGKIYISCVTPAAEGMVISTDSQKVLESRRVVLELLMTSHPDTCPICDKGNNCQLRKLVADIGMGEVRYTKFRRFFPLEDANPFIERDLTKCILCGKCVRVCQEIPVIGAVDYAFRGFKAKPAAEMDKPLEESKCEFCGACIYTCPVQALADKKRKFYGREEKSVNSVCPFCACGCSIKLLVRKNEVVRVVPNTLKSVGKMALCPKGRFGYDFILGKDRLNKPLLRKNGELTEVNWDEALDFVVEKISNLKDKFGPNSLAGLISAKLTSEEIFLFYDLMENVSSIDNVFNQIDLCLRPVVEVLRNSTGKANSTITFDQLEEADLIVLFDSNLIKSYPVASHALRRAVAFNETKLVIIDPRESKLNRFADLVLKPTIGTDYLVLSALIKSIIKSELTGTDMIGSKIDNFKEFKDSLNNLNLEEVEKNSNISGKLINELAELLNKAKKPLYIFSGGLFQNKNGYKTAESLVNLIIITRIITKQDTPFIMLSGHNNGQGLIDIESIFYPEGRKTGISKLYDLLASKDIKGLYIIGQDILNSLPDRKFLNKALENLEILIVQDIFLNETAKLADVVLPAVTFAEKEGTFVSAEGKVQKIHQGIKPLGNAFSDEKIFSLLSEKLGIKTKYDTTEQVWEEIENRFYSKEFTKEANNLFPFTNELKSIKDNNYPFLLLTGRSLFHFGSGGMSDKSRSLRFQQPAGYANVSLEDAKSLGLKDGEVIKIKSESGEVEARLKIDQCLLPGYVLVPFHFKNLQVNNLFKRPAADSFSAFAYKGLPVIIEKANKG